LWKRMWKKPALNILITHVAKPTFESNGVLVVWSQCLVNVMHQVMYTFIKYPCCSCEWALWENLCKHWIMVILMCTNIIQETSLNNVKHSMDLIVEGSHHVCELVAYCGWWGLL
jgi:hypothetical protein